MSLQEEVDEVLQFADSLIELIRDRSNIEKLVQSRRQLELDRKRVERYVRESEERNKRLSAKKDSLLSIERKAVKCGLPNVDPEELINEDSTVSLLKEEEKAIKKNEKLREKIQELKKENLEEQQLKYVHDLQRTVAPVQFDENMAQDQIRGFMKKDGGDIKTFNFDTKTMSRDTISNHLWSAV